MRKKQYKHEDNRAVQRDDMPKMCGPIEASCVSFEGQGSYSSLLSRWQDNEADSALSRSNPQLCGF